MYILSFFLPVNTLNGTAKAPTVDILGLNTLRGTRTTLFTPKGRTSHPFYMRISPPQVFTMWISRLAQVLGHLYVLPLPLEVQIPAPSLLSSAPMKLYLGGSRFIWLGSWLVGRYSDRPCARSCLPQE